MTPQPSRLDVAASADGTSLVLTGVLDSHTADDLLEDIRRSPADVRLDLGAVDFIDSSGLRSLITAHQEFEETGKKVVLTNIGSAVDRLFEITSLREYLHIQ